VSCLVQIIIKFWFLVWKTNLLADLDPNGISARLKWIRTGTVRLFNANSDHCAILVLNPRKWLSICSGL